MRKFKEGDIVIWDDLPFIPHIFSHYEFSDIHCDGVFIQGYEGGNLSKTKESRIKKMEHEFAIEFVDNKQSVSEAKNRQEGGEHYKVSGIEPWDVIDTWPMEQRIGYYRGNLLKYTMRCGLKDAQEIEIKKAAHYAEKLLEVLAEKNRKEG